MTTRSSPICAKSTVVNDPRSNALYGAGAGAYARHADTSLFNSGYERPAMFEAIGSVDGLRVIDAGCAAGHYTARLAESAAHVTALDLSPEMIALVQARELANVDARVHDLAQPFAWIASGSVDAIISSLALHYLADWQPVMREFGRVLRPGGRLIFSTHHPSMSEPLAANYFEVSLVREQWTIGGEQREVTFYHRSFEAILAPVLQAGLVIDALLEPHLAMNPDATEDERLLATRPWFFIVAARRVQSNR